MPPHDRCNMKTTLICIHRDARIFMAIAIAGSPHDKRQTINHNRHVAYFWKPADNNKVDRLTMISWKTCEIPFHGRDGKKTKITFQVPVEASVKSSGNPKKVKQDEILC